jgi:hypothetical protein
MNYAFPVPTEMDPDLDDALDPDGSGPGTTAPEPGPGDRPDGPEPSTATVPAHQAGLVPSPGTTASVVPGLAVPQQRTSLAEHLLLSLRDWAKRTADSQKRHRSFWHWLWAEIVDSRPDSLAEHVAYLRSRQWLEDHMTGWLRSFAEWETIAFGLLVGIPLKVIGNNLSRLGERQWRFWAVVVFLAVIAWKAAS